MRRTDLVTHCAACAALCCTATCFDASEDFALAKPAGVPCPHVTPGHACAIHDQLRERGFAGCTAYECYGAGPRATRAFAGAAPALRDAAFLVLKDLHELLFLLTEARKLLPPVSPLCAALTTHIAVLDAMASQEAPALAALDPAPLHDHAHRLLRQVGAAIGGRKRMLPLV